MLAWWRAGSTRRKPGRRRNACATTSEEFTVAEIDSTYHFFATANNLNLWLDNTPEGFKFNIKAFSLFTLHPTPFDSLPRGFRETYAASLPAKPTLYLHHLPEDAADNLWQGFARTVERFQAAGKLGAVLFPVPSILPPRGRQSEAHRKVPAHAAAIPDCG